MFYGSANIDLTKKNCHFRIFYSRRCWFSIPQCVIPHSNFFSCEKLSDFTMFCGPENWPTQLSVNYKACQMRAYQMLRSLPETALNFVWSTPSEELCLSQSAGRAVNQYFKDISEFYFYSESRHCILAISTCKTYNEKVWLYWTSCSWKWTLLSFYPHLKCGYIINRSYHKSFIHFQLYQGQASNVFAASPLI